MKTIPIGHNTAEVSDNDYVRTIQQTWSLHRRKDDNRYYAETRMNGKRVSMHKFILNDDTIGTVKHRDGNLLNNQRNNLTYRKKEIFVPRIRSNGMYKIHAIEALL